MRRRIIVTMTLYIYIPYIKAEHFLLKCQIILINSHRYTMYTICVRMHVSRPEFIGKPLISVNSFIHRPSLLTLL